jgi:hypothetical protein
MNSEAHLRFVAAGHSLRPARLLTIVVIGFFVSLVLMPVQPTAALVPAAVVYWLLVTLSLWLGMWCGGLPTRARAHPAVRMRSIGLARAARRTVFLGSVGILLLGIDRFGLRGAPLAWNVMEVRDAVEATSTGLVGLLAAFFGAFAPFGFIVCALARANGERVSAAVRLVGAAVALLYVLLSVMQGSRSVMLVVVIVHACAFVYLSRLKGRRTPVKALALGAALLLAAALASAVILLERLEQMGLDPLLSIQVSGYAEALQPSAAVLQSIEAYPAGSGLFAALFSLCLYLYHGFFEFSLLFTQFAADHTWGAWVFWLPVKVVSVSTGLTLGVDPAQLAGVREGIFTSFVGPVYVDFGWFAPLAMLVLGWLLAQPAAQLAKGNSLWLLGASTVCAIVLMYPMLNLIDSSAGSYLLVASVIVTRLNKSWRRHNSSESPAV